MLTVRYEYVCDACGAEIRAPDVFTMDMYGLLGRPTTIPLPYIPHAVGATMVCEACLQKAWAPLLKIMRERKEQK